MIHLREAAFIPMIESYHQQKDCFSGHVCYQIYTICYRVIKLNLVYMIISCPKPYFKSSR